MCYWLDLVSFFNSFLKSYQELVGVNYFSARPTDAGKHDRQDKLFQANKCNPKFNLILGKYLKKRLNAVIVVVSFILLKKKRQMYE